MKRTILAVYSALVVSGAALAQPAPSFQATCAELRQAMAGLKSREENELVAIEVVGDLKLVYEGPGLVYLGLCGPPHPRVLCVTYQTNGRKVGDRVVVVGTIVPRGPEFVQLDPCLHSLPDEDDKK
ncbi:MAG: hypothetical protein R3D62_15555 [Xanthobacteraceae bacterium]